MSVITWPSTLRVGPGSGFGQVRYDLMFSSEMTGASQDRVLGPPRWTLSILQPAVLKPDEAGQWQSVLMQLRGRTNHLLAPDFSRLAPRGTMRGTMTLSADPALGATSISITAGAGQANTTLKAGDKLQIGTGLGTSQLVMVTADATANGSGVITVSVEPPLRVDFASGAAVTWDRASAYFKLAQSSTGWQFNPSVYGPLMTGMALDLTEAFN